MKKAIKAKMETEEKAIRRKLLSRIFSLDIDYPLTSGLGSGGGGMLISPS